MPKPIFHAAVSSVIAAGTFAATGKASYAAAALAAGTMLDADHFVDFAVVKGTREHKWIVLPLHGWELGLGMLLTGFRKPIFAFAGFSYLVHLTLDQLFNGLGRAGVYSLLWRLAYGFQTTKMNVKVRPHSWANEPMWKWFF